MAGSRRRRGGPSAEGRSAAAAGEAEAAEPQDEQPAGGRKRDGRHLGHRGRGADRADGVNPEAWPADTLARLPDRKTTKVNELLPWRRDAAKG